MSECDMFMENNHHAGP